MTPKQEAFLDGLLEKHNYVLIVDKKTLSVKLTSDLIQFLRGDHSDYIKYRQYIRMRGPKIQNLVGDYLYEENFAWAHLKELLY